LVVRPARFTAPFETNSVPLPAQALRPRGCLSLQSFVLPKPRKLHGLLPPLSAFCVIRPIGFIGSERHPHPVKFVEHPLLRFRATSASSSRSPLPLYSRSTSTVAQFRKAPCFSSSFAFQRFRIQEPFFSLPFRGSVHKHSALACGSHTLGFGYPLDVCFFSSRTLGSLFQPPTLVGFTLQSFVSRAMIEEEFPLLIPLLRFFRKPRGLPSALQRLSPISRAVPLFATRSFSPGRGHLLSWVFSPLGLLVPQDLFTQHLPG